MANSARRFPNFLQLLPAFCTFATLITSSEVPRPRGVSLSRAPLYDPSKDFTCFDGSLTIAFDRVNDDYCDCPDGSDEPGTAACIEGTFYCTNSGHKPSIIASWRVNDGVCDCCDGSDEYERSECINNCNELGRSAREEAQKRAELIKAGKQVREELITKGVHSKQEKKEQLAELEKNKSEAEKIRLEKEALKKDIEDLENEALKKYREIEEEERKLKEAEEEEKNRKTAKEKFVYLDSNSDGKLDTSELQTRKSFDQDRNGEVSEDEAKFFLNQKDEVDFEEFYSESWTKIRPYLMIEEGFYKGPEEEKIEDDGEADGEGEPEELSEGDDADNPENIEPDPEDAEDTDPEDEDDDEDDSDPDTEEPETREKSPEPKEQPPTPKYDEETQNLITRAEAARKEYSEADKQVSQIQRKIQDIRDYLEKDFGPEEEFATLEGRCFEYSDYEYVYKLCPFDSAVQTPKASGSETRLGVWSKWTGPEGDLYSSMLYDRGQSCWNGPQRSTTVRVTCGGESEVTAVSEPNRCEYLFDFTTPAACRDVKVESQDDLHDEL